jgi:uncharacterized OB-fold protein
VGAKCPQCTTYVFPPRANNCPNPACAADELEPVALSRRGTLWSYTENHYAPPPPYPAADPFEPFAVAAVQLDTEGIIVLGKVVEGMDVLKAIEGHDERIGACADLGHYIRSGEKPTEVIRLLKGRLYGIHLKDFQDMQDVTKGVILGKGHLDVPAVMAALVQTNFPKTGALSLEYEESPENPLADIRQCYAVAADALAKT